MRTLTAVLVLSLVAMLFMGCEKNITNPATDQPGEPAAQSLGTSEHQYADGVPFYGTNWIYTFEGYGVYFFYVADPGVIAPDRNLILVEGPAFDALAHEQTVANSSHWMEDVPFSPKNWHVRGTGPVEFWFFSAEDAEALVADLQVTRAEMESYGPIKGWATMFREDNLIYPVTAYSMTAQGDLEGGGTFHVNAHERFYGPGPFDARWDGNIILKR